MNYEWDRSKAAENFRKHEVSFEQAVVALQDPFGVEWIDDREDYGEMRTVLLGTANGTILTVVYTERDEDTIRIISARRATRDEQDTYFEENSKR